MWGDNTSTPLEEKEKEKDEDKAIEFYKKALEYIIEKNQQGIFLAEGNSTILLKKILSKQAVNYMDLRSPCGGAIGQIAYYYDGNIYIISEGGLKFIGLSENKKVCICIYEDYTNMNNLCGLQISGNSEILEPWCEEYMETLDRKGLKIENILKLPFNMNIIKVIPDKYEFLYSKFKNLGFDSKQTYIPNK